MSKTKSKFKIEKSILDRTAAFILSNENASSIEILPEFGGILNAFITNRNNENLNIIEGYYSEFELETIGRKEYRGAKLFPWPNRIRDGIYSFNNKEYQLTINQSGENNALHGFIFDKPFGVSKETVEEKFCSLELTYEYDGNLSGFPFPFRISVCHSLLENNTYECITNVENKGSESMPCGDGWHPYFTTGNKVEHLILELPDSKYIETDNRLIPTGNTKTVDFNGKIREKHFDSCFELVMNKEKNAATKITDPEKNIQIIIWQSTAERNYNYLQVYTPPSRNSIAIEPMSCLPNAFNNKKGLFILKPGERWASSYGIKIKTI